ncbi:MAG: hypothetical protein ABI548_17090 [Polyangiaceae bacterium]
MGVAKSSARVRWRNVVLRVCVGGVSLGAAWLALTIHPQPLFAYSLRQDNVVLYARSPFPAAASQPSDPSAGIDEFAY